MIDIFIDNLWITIPGFVVILSGCIMLCECIPKLFDPYYKRSDVINDIRIILILIVLILLSLIAANMFVSCIVN